LGLADVRREEKLAFQSQSTGNVEKINSTCSKALAMDGRKLNGSVDGSVHVQRHFQQSPSRDEAIHAGQRGIALTRDVPALAGGPGTTLVKGALKNGIADFQCVQG